MDSPGGVANLPVRDRSPTTSRYPLIPQRVSPSMLLGAMTMSSFSPSFDKPKMRSQITRGGLPENYLAEMAGQR